MLKVSLQAILAVTEQDDEEPKVVDLDHSKELTKEIRKELLSRAMESDDMENERFLQKVKARLDRYAFLIIAKDHQVIQC